MRAVWRGQSLLFLCCALVANICHVCRAGIAIICYAVGIMRSHFGIDEEGRAVQALPLLAGPCSRGLLCGKVRSVIAMRQSSCGHECRKVAMSQHIAACRSIAYVQQSGEDASRDTLEAERGQTRRPCDERVFRTSRS
jgi:hypothetical protein